MRNYLTHDIGRYKGPIAHIIKLKPDAKLPYTGVPRHSAYTNQEAKKHVDAMLANGIIRPSTSHCTSRFLIVPKPNG
uniref:RNA-directed DNA polymerase n=1 Tax=Strongyloides papillosus TaxID=174720 RepID=A0A0N5BZH1_STREA